MSVILSSLIFVFIFTQFCNCIEINSNQKYELGKVIFANILYRHGERTLKSTYPTDPYKNCSFWPEGYGQLTNKGKLQHFKLGQWLRKRYASLLTEKYNEDTIYVWSTDVDRTLMSAECNLAGMFPPVDGQVWNKHLPWQPIPVHTVPGSQDQLFYRNTSVETPYLLTVRGCSSICPLDTFIRLCEPIMPEDWDKECKLSFFTNRTIFVTIVVAAIVIVIVIIFACVSCGCRRMKTPSIIWSSSHLKTVQISDPETS